jgi:hypothetical protein
MHVKYDLMQDTLNKMFVSAATEKCFVSCLFFLILTTTISFSAAIDQATSVPPSSTIKFIPYRSNRYILFFFSDDVTVTLFEETITKKLIEFDNFCGGENFQTTIFYGSKPVHDFDQNCSFCSLETFFQSIKNITLHNLNTSLAKNIAAGSLDDHDVNNVSANLVGLVRDLENFQLQPQGVNMKTQVILVTDYATNTIGSNDTSEAFAVLKAGNVSFIALTSSLNDSDKYFPKEIWLVYSDYINWTSNNTNPICGYEIQQYSKSFQI